MIYLIIQYSYTHCNMNNLVKSVNEAIGFMNKYKNVLYYYWVGRCFAIINIEIMSL